MISPLASVPHEILASLVRKGSKVTPQMAEEFVATSLNLSACQKITLQCWRRLCRSRNAVRRAEDRLVGASKPR